MRVLLITIDISEAMKREHTQRRASSQANVLSVVRLVIRLMIQYAHSIRRIKAKEVNLRASVIYVE